MEGLKVLNKLNQPCLFLTQCNFLSEIIKQLSFFHSVSKKEEEISYLYVFHSAEGYLIYSEGCW